MSESPPIPDPMDDDAAPSELQQVRDLILGSHSDLVPELVQGNTISDLVASIVPAREAYSRAIASVPAPEPPVTIPAGGNAPVAFDIDALPASEKIRRGLASAHRSGR